MQRSLMAAAMLGLMTGAAGRAEADMIYTDQASFLAAIEPGSYLETFNGLPLGYLESALLFSDGTFSYSASATNSFSNLEGGGGDVWLSTNDSGYSITFSTGSIATRMSGSGFTTMAEFTITAIGGFFFGTASGDVAPGTVTATLGNGTSFSIVNPGSTSFIGFTSNLPITSLTISGPSGTFVTANDVIVGQAITTTQAAPEPSTLALAGLGGLCLIGMMRRRRSA